MTEKKLREIYNKYLKFNKFYYAFDSKNNSTSLRGMNLPDKILGQFYDNYVRPSFASFFLNVKNIIYAKNVYEFVMKNSSEDWKLWPYLRFLEKEKIIKVKRDGGVIVIKKEILNLIPAFQEEKEIRQKIERKLRLKIKDNEPVINLFKKLQNFEVKGKWDQMPISQGSAIFVAKKILEKIPFNKKFLFVGDDDFVSVVLGLANPNIESLVIDIDENLLECIDALAKKFKLKIKTKKVDFRKDKDLGEKFIGFLTNPIYTEDGTKEFVKYGKDQLSKDGGFAFLEVGDESIENRFLFLQDFFTKNNLLIKELTSNKVFYPYIEIYDEDKEILKRLSSMMDERVIKNSPRLAVSLYVFEYFPQTLKRVKFKKPIYAYL